MRTEPRKGSSSVVPGVKSGLRRGSRSESREKGEDVRACVEGKGETTLTTSV